MPSKRDSVGRPVSYAAIGAATCAAAALWVSFGALSFVDTDDRAAYVGLLPSPFWFALLLVGALALIGIVRPAASAIAPLWLSAVALLPWLPVPLPLSVFLWTGNSLLWLWAVIIAALVAPYAGGAVRAVGLARRTPEQMAAGAAILAALAYGLGAWSVAPVHPDGDEPHYLIVTQSIIQDFDLQIENNHRQRDYDVYLDRAIKPDFLQRGTNGQIYSIHAPGLPVLVTPAFALLGYRGVMFELVFLSAIGSFLAWVIAWRATGDVAATWFGWSAAAMSAPFFLQTSSIFPDGVAAVLMLFAVLPLVDPRAREARGLMMAGGALAALPWLHSRFAILAVTAGLVIAARVVMDRSGRTKRLVAFAVVPATSAVAWFLFFQMIYGTPNPAVVYGGNTSTAIGNIVRGAPGLLFDQQFGLIATAPVYLCAIGGLVVMIRRGCRRLAVELLAITVPYFLVAGFFFMWWAGTTPPARFLVPLALVGVIPMAVWFASARGAAARLASIATLMVSLFITMTVVSVGRGAFVFNFRDGMSRLALWLSPVVDLTKALPSLFQNPPPTVLAQTSVWLAAFAAATVIGALSSRRGRAWGVLGFGLALEVSAMAAVSSVWRSNDTVAVTPFAAGPALLRRFDGSAGQLALSYRPFQRLEPADLPGQIVLARVLSSVPRPESATVTPLPSGTYEISGASVGAASGRVRLKTDRVSGPIAEWDAASLGSTWSRQVTIPIPLAGLQIDIDPAARRALRDVSIRAVSLPPIDEGLGNRLARRASRYGPAIVFLLDGEAWVEPGGTWVAGGSTAEFAIAPDAQSPFRLLVRNAPVENEVTLESGTWRDRTMMKPGEERFVQLPVDAGRRLIPLKVAATSGFRPADLDPKIEDIRFLGVWIETR